MKTWRTHARWLILVPSIVLGCAVGAWIFFLLTRVSIERRVFDLAGKPVVGARVSDGVQSTVTDADGRFTLRTKNTTASLTVSTDDVQITWPIKSNENVSWEAPSRTKIFGTDENDGLTPADRVAIDTEISTGYYPVPVDITAPPEETITLPITQTTPTLPPPMDASTIITNSEGVSVVSGEILVGWNEGVSSTDRTQRITAAGGTVRYDDADSRTTIVYVTDTTQVDTVLKKLQATSGVTGALYNYLLEPDDGPNDPDYADTKKNWWLRALNAEPAWAITEGSPRLVVAVIDAGFELDHPDLTSAFTQTTLNYTNTPINTDPKHGTHVSGIIAARKNNGQGLMGIAPNVRILPVRINDIARLASVYQQLSKYPSVRIATMSMGLGWGKKNAARVAAGSPAFTAAEMQQRSSAFDAIIAPAYTNFYSLGGVMCKSAGNDYGLDARLNTLNFPSVITVGASTITGDITAFSNVGPKVDVLAPGSNIWSTISGHTYGYLSGTSMATPVVCGTVASIRSVRPRFGAELIKRILQKSSVDESGTYRLLDSWRALLRATKQFGVMGTVESFDQDTARATINTSPAHWSLSADSVGNFVIPFLERKSWTLEALSGEAKGKTKIDAPALSDDEVLDDVSILLEKEEDTNTNAETNQNTNSEDDSNTNEETNDNTNESDEGNTGSNANANSNANTSTDTNTNTGTSTESVEGTGSHTLANGLVISGEGCAESGFEIPENAAGNTCPNGFTFSRDTIACEQTTCPDGVGRTYTLECKCEAPNTAIYACTTPGYLVACLPSND